MKDWEWESMFEKLGLVMVVSESLLRISLIDERLRMRINVW
jgi:hypothetical protein